MAGSDPRDEGFAQWLVDTDKVVLSASLGEAPWERTTIVDRPTAVVADLKATGGGDILVLSSERPAPPTGVSGCAGDSDNHASKSLA